MKTTSIVPCFVALVFTHGCAMDFDLKEDTERSKYTQDSSQWTDQDADDGNMDTDKGDDACPEDPNKTDPGECGCGVPEGACAGPDDTGTEDLCDPDPCAHGFCFEDSNTHYCQCEKGWTGANCEQNIDDCQLDSCVNGTCVDGIDDYSCHCEYGWTGAKCSQSVNDCDLDPCLNGTCLGLARQEQPGPFPA
jgi:hypothetical protein